MEYPKQYLYRRVVQAKLFIETNYASPIDLENISDEACFSKFHFLRLFKKLYGKTPYQYLISIRIEKAKQLLQSGATVSETCYSIGFQSLSSFSGLFKKITGTNPVDFIADYHLNHQAVTMHPLTQIPGCFSSGHLIIK